MDNPLVSYVVPCYNCGEHGAGDFMWLRQCHVSLVEQLYCPIEYIFVDDGSTDGTREVLNFIAKRDARAHIISIPHGGVAVALNTGIATAKGEWIGRLDADDVAYPERTTKQMKWLNEHPEIDVLGGAMIGSEVVGEKDGSTVVLEPQKRMPPMETEPDAVRGLTIRSCPFMHPTVMFRKKVWEDVGGYPTEYTACEDYAFWVRVLRWYNGANIQHALTYYRRHGRQHSVRRASEQTANAARCQMEARQMLVDRRTITDDQREVRADRLATEDDRRESAEGSSE